MPVDPTTLPAWAPTTSRIASLLWEHARETQDTAGEGGVLVDEPKLGTFTEHTTPTLAVVEEMIEQACDTMAGMLEGHEPCNDGLTRGVRGAAAYLAAALSEQSREQQAAASEDSAYRTFLLLWQDRGQAIAERVKASCPFVPDPGGEPTEGGRLRPVAKLPCNERIGWGTRW